ncbi:thioredoxin [Bordetella sp. H567]|uniref:TlpA family protein disulfide reductase n=1 Tax=Bordetella sp. H567 TaxID=1697043 RepID=UPI00081C846D|nr:TlpA disulfide reductase family protein [Bordetella sp. H567]AOB29850.1 thioredoxin [Bordetella sp. H567]
MKRRTALQSLMALGGAAGAVPAWVRAAAQADPAAVLLEQSYPDLEGKPQALAQWKGRPMLVNFWATWCPPCVKEMPELDGLHKQHAGVQFLGLAIDSAVNVVKFASKLPVSYPLLVAGAGSIDVMRSLGNGPGALPFTVLLGADGRISRKILGPVDVADVEKWLREVAA